MDCKMSIIDPPRPTIDTKTALAFWSRFRNVKLFNSMFNTSPLALRLPHNWSCSTCLMHVSVLHTYSSPINTKAQIFIFAFFACLVGRVPYNSKNFLYLKYFPVMVLLRVQSILEHCSFSDLLFFCFVVKLLFGSNN